MEGIFETQLQWLNRLEKANYFQVIDLFYGTSFMLVSKSQLFIFSMLLILFCFCCELFESAL